MIILGLTGSIGMGKSTTAAMFAQAGAAVYDADGAVHQLYAPGGAAVEPVGQAFPGVIRSGRVDRDRLSAALRDDPSSLARLESIVHPLLAQHRAELLATARANGARVAVLEIPLLFETGVERWVDAVVVVSAPPEVQMERVLRRPGMSAEKLDLFLSRQLPDADKRARGDFIIDTGQGLEAARLQVLSVLQTVLDPAWRAAEKSV